MCVFTSVFDVSEELALLVLLLLLGWLLLFVCVCVVLVLLLFLLGIVRGAQSLWWLCKFCFSLQFIIIIFVRHFNLQLSEQRFLHFHSLADGFSWHCFSICPPPPLPPPSLIMIVCIYIVCIY